MRFHSIFDTICFSDSRFWIFSALICFSFSFSFLKIFQFHSCSPRLKKITLILILLDEFNSRKLHTAHTRPSFQLNFLPLISLVKQNTHIQIKVYSYFSFEPFGIIVTLFPLCYSQFFACS